MTSTISAMGFRGFGKLVAVDSNELRRWRLSRLV
jgi:hypothetical protein